MGSVCDVYLPRLSRRLGILKMKMVTVWDEVVGPVTSEL